MESLYLYLTAIRPELNLTVADPGFLAVCPAGSRDEEPSCGRPLGIRVGPNGTLFVADAYLGLFEVNPTTGELDAVSR